MYSLDYSRFDHIGDSDDSSQASTVEPPAEEEAPSAEPAGAGVARAIADALNPRLPDAIVLCVHAFLPCARCGASMADGEELSAPRRSPRARGNPAWSRQTRRGRPAM